MGYTYQLEQSINENYSELQAEKLLSEGYIFNDRESTYDLYEEIFENVEYVDFSYFSTKEVESPVGEYEVYKERKVIDVKYKILKKEKGFTGFFKNIYNKFVSKKEHNINKTRIEELELLLGKGEISDLQKIEKFNIVGGVEKLTNNEIIGLQKKGIKYSFLRMLNETKKETIKEQTFIQKLEFNEFIKNYKDIETIIDKRYKEKELKEKIIKDRRVKMMTSMNFYVPGIWSQNGSHELGSKAEFSCEVNVEYISGFNPYDRKYFNRETIQEKIIKIIEDEHFNAVYIRQRGDNKDGFNLEKTIIN